MSSRLLTVQIWSYGERVRPDKTPRLTQWALKAMRLRSQGSERRKKDEDQRQFSVKSQKDRKNQGE